MKIVFLHLTMGLSNRGSEQVIETLASALAKNDQVMVIQAGPITKKTYLTKRVYPLPQAPIPAPLNFLDKLKFRLQLDDESLAVSRFTTAALPHLRHFAPDLIVAVNGAPQLKILQAAKLSSKLVVFGHAGIGHHDRSTLKLSPDLFVALSRPALTWATQLASSSTKVVYVPNPIIVEPFTKGKPASTNLIHPIVLTVSALSHYKNIPSVVAAVGANQASYLLIGDGEDSTKVARALSTLSTSFNWIKHVEPVDIPSYYHLADVFCFTPDPQEALGMVYLEAMAAGLPIVASDDAIRRDLIGKQGIYVDPHDQSSVTQGIKTALKLKRLKYREELKPYHLTTIVAALKKEFHVLIN